MIDKVSTIDLAVRASGGCAAHSRAATRRNRVSQSEVSEGPRRIFGITDVSVRGAPGCVGLSGECRTVRTSPQLDRYISTDLGTDRHIGRVTRRRPPPSALVGVGRFELPASCSQSRETGVSGCVGLCRDLSRYSDLAGVMSGRSDTRRTGRHSPVLPVSRLWEQEAGSSNLPTPTSADGGGRRRVTRPMCRCITDVSDFVSVSEGVGHGLEGCRRPSDVRRNRRRLMSSGVRFDVVGLQ